MYELLSNFIKQILAILVSELREAGRQDDRIDGTELLARIASRIASASVPLEEEIVLVYKRNRIENERAFIDRVCFPEYFGDRIKVGENSSFKLKKNFAVLLGCDEWDYSEEADEYGRINEQQQLIGATMRERMREITGTSYGDFARARAFFSFTGKIAFVKLVRELTMDLRNGDGTYTVGLKQAMEFANSALQAVTEDILISKAELRRLLERYIVN